MQLARSRRSKSGCLEGRDGCGFRPEEQSASNQWARKGNRGPHVHAASTCATESYVFGAVCALAPAKQTGVSSAHLCAASTPSHAGGHLDAIRPRRRAIAHACVLIPIRPGWVGRGTARAGSYLSSESHLSSPSLRHSLRLKKKK